MSLELPSIGTANWLANADNPATPVNISAMLHALAQQIPEHVAVGRADIRLSYRELDALVTDASTQLDRLGIRPGQRVALVSDNCLEFVIALFACLALEASVVPLGGALTLAEFQSRFAQVGVDAIIAPRHLKSLFDTWADETSAAGNVAWYLVEVQPGPAVAVEVIRQDKTPKAVPASPGHDNVALILFTAGSSSAPKAVPLTHANLLSSIRGIVNTYRLAPADRTLVVMPLFHGHGLVAGLLATLASGGSAFLPIKGSFSARLFWQEMIDAQATWYTAVPTIHHIVVNRPTRELASASALSLRFIRSCSAPLDDEIVSRLSQVLNAPVVGAYGMTETAHQAASNPLPALGDNRPDTVGPATGVEARIIKADGTIALPGETGEICVRGASLTSGYLDNASANATGFVDGWFHTGDLGAIDMDGYITISGRLKDVINRGGEKISPARIDNVLLSHPAILEAAAFGEPDAVYGETVSAAVSLNGRLQDAEDALRRFAAISLAAYEVPTRIYVLEALPHTSKGSVDRKALAERFRP